jgi:TolB protein
MTRRIFTPAWLAFLLLAAIALLTPSSRAALTIEIVGSGANQIPIAIAPFRAEQGIPQQLTPIIIADLARSGLFRTVDAGGIVPVPHEPDQINYGQWKARGAEALVIGSVVPRDGQFEVSFRLMDVVKGTQLAGFF